MREKKRTWKFLNQIFESSNEKVRIWSTKGFIFLAVGGTPKICRYAFKSEFFGKDSKRDRLEREKLTCVKSSFTKRPHSVSSKPLSKLTRPRLPFRQFPVIFSSSIVCTFCTCIFTLGPFGVFVAQRYKSSCRLASKYNALLQLFRSANSGSKCR